jgi:hypothetical protein
MNALLDEQRADLEPIDPVGLASVRQVVFHCHKCGREVAEVGDLQVPDESNPGMGWAMPDRDGRRLGAVMRVQERDDDVVAVARRYGKRATSEARAGWRWLLFERPPALDPIPTLCWACGPRQIERAVATDALRVARASDEEQVRYTAKNRRRPTALYTSSRYSSQR